MKNAHAIAAAVGAAVVITTGALTIDAAVDDKERPTTGARLSGQSEPFDEAIDDRLAAVYIDISRLPDTGVGVDLSRIHIADRIERSLHGAERDADLSEWLAGQDSISDEEWWNFEKRLLEEVLDEIRGR